MFYAIATTNTEPYMPVTERERTREYTNKNKLIINKKKLSASCGY